LCSKRKRNEKRRAERKKEKLLIHAMASTGVKDVSKYLALQQADSDKEIAAQWTNFEELYNKK
jgi:hypothetical protein